MVKVTSKSVIFTLESDANKLWIQGSWNDWQPEAMKRERRTGRFRKIKRLKPGRYEFGYLTGEGAWLIDETLPTVPSPFGSRNSLLELQP
jgi:5'-AMP-activated protein kinase regulatory beta subunit